MRFALTGGGGRQRGRIGLDFAPDRLHIVQLEKDRSDNVRTIAAESYPYPASRADCLSSRESLSKFLRTALKRSGVHGLKVHTVMPGERVRTFPLSFNVGAGRSEAQALLAILEERLDGSLDEYVIDYMPIRGESEDRSRLAVVVVVDRGDVIDFLELLRHCGLDVEALEVQSSALRRLTTAFSGPQHRNLVLVNFGETKSDLTLISGRRMLFNQELAFGESRLIRALAKSLSMSEEEARATVNRYGLAVGEDQSGEISRTLREIARPVFQGLVEQLNRAFIFAAAEDRGNTVDGIYVAGSLSGWKGTAALLDEMLSIPVSMIPNPLRHVGEPWRPELAVALGLAMRDLEL
ncbi:MAG: pilus assembly protein PilM [Gammaproteobacteria bacterium]